MISVDNDHGRILAGQSALHVRKDPSSGAGSTVPKPRAYQQEMLAESLRQNIIITVIPSIGKIFVGQINVDRKLYRWILEAVKQISPYLSFVYSAHQRRRCSAILRMQEELARCPQTKLVWFVAPTVALAEQQHTVISQQLPAFQTRFLSGSDNVDHWSSQEIWDSILFNIRIVVSTPQVLLDAMSRGFVKLTRIALLVFDEAHRCVSSDPTNMIMQNFYHRYRKSGNADELPSILGLTASPVTKANIKGLSTIEENMNAICRSPTVHREELLRYVRQPQVCKVIYKYYTVKDTPLLESLHMVVRSTLNDIGNDPFVDILKRKADSKSKEKLSNIVTSGKTPCRVELMGLKTRADVIHQELGPWAADVFVAACIERFNASTAEISLNSMFIDWQISEKIYMKKVLSQIEPIQANRVWGSPPDALSHKAEQLIEFLARSYTPGFRAIIFAQQRSTVVMLAHLLSVHPKLGQIIPAHFLGNSSYANRKSNIFELSHPREQKSAIDDLRIGTKNLLVATSVLEEGIDVSACNLVVCFDPPANLRSFIQRRGRARKEKSKFVIFLEENEKDGEEKWRSMEEEMRKIYSDNMRLLAEIEAKENVAEESPDFFLIDSTGALLNYQNARSYLEHFCATISCAYTENRPEFIVHWDSENKLCAAKVILPSFLDPSLREVEGSSIWMTERMAKRDAAYQAYCSLYKAGLVNDNLMPMHCEGQINTTEPVEKRERLVQVATRFNPWIEIAKMRQDNEPLFPTNIEFSHDAHDLPPMTVLLPRSLPCELNFILFWNEEVTITVSLLPNSDDLPTAASHCAPDISHLLLSSVFRGRIPANRRDLTVLFLPKLGSSVTLDKTWLASVTGTTMAHEVPDIQDPKKFPKLGMFRRADRFSRPFMIEDTILMVPVDDRLLNDNAGPDDTGEPPEELHIQGITFPKRTDFLHPVARGVKGNLHHTARQCVAARICSVNRLPAEYSRFALFIPSIIHKIEILLVAERLSCTILAPIHFNDLNLVMTAISASSAREATNYQRLEFLGDSLLKFHTSIHLTANKPLWHEGLLSFSKDRIVSNARLSRAALELGLDAYILTQAFTGLKWRPSYISELINSESTNDSGRQLSTKVLADVVEALVGAAYADGGNGKTIECLHVFLPEVSWESLERGVRRLNSSVRSPDDSTISSFLPQIEALLGYTFVKKSLLLEALTHPCSRDKTMSYQRLEFLGDALLDHIVVQELFHCPRHITHQDMHLMRTALVNADFLAFLCMSVYIDEAREEPVKQDGAHILTAKTIRKVYLWQFMRHSASGEISVAQQATLRRYDHLHDRIHEALANSPTYPWILLLQLEAAKFFSDIIESILAAIFIDSDGSLEACQEFLNQIGLSAYLRRVLNGEVDLLHPRNRLHHLARSARVSFDIRPEKVVDTTPSGHLKLICTVRVGAEDIVEIGDGMNRAEVEARVAAAAADILEQRELGLKRQRSPEVGDTL